MLQINKEEVLVRKIIKKLDNGFSRISLDTDLFLKIMQSSRARWNSEKPSLKFTYCVDGNGEGVNTNVFAFEGKDKETVNVYYYSHDTGKTENVFSKKNNRNEDKAVYEPIFIMETAVAEKYLEPYKPVDAPFDIKATDFSTDVEDEAEVA